MTLPQRLKPSERGVRLNDRDGNFLGYEDITTVSAEDLEEEARVAKLQELVNKPQRTNEENTQMLDLLAAKQGIELPKNKLVEKVE